MRGRAGYIHDYAKDLGMNDDEAVYPSFYLRQKFCRFVLDSDPSNDVERLRLSPGCCFWIGGVCKSLEGVDAGVDDRSFAGE